MKNYRDWDDMFEDSDDTSELLKRVNELTGDYSEFEETAEVYHAPAAPKARRKVRAQVPEDIEPEELFRPTKERRVMPVWLVAIINILMTGVILLTFAFFHHVLPAMISARERQEAMLNATLAPTEEITEPATGEITEPPTEAHTEAPTEPPDLRTEWQKKFEEHFTDEIVQTENSYSSPNVSITVETISYGEGRNKQTYHVADIYIGSMENFTTFVAGAPGTYSTESVENMSEAANALIAISGDFVTYQKGGFLMRNSTVYAETTNNVSICALFPDGSIETYEDREYTIDDIKERGAIQVWSFGPTLLDENGQVRSKYDVPRAVSYPNPRSAIGYYEPGHYCFVVVDGRQEGYAKGMTIPELAQVFVDLGCTKAYNLDGGGSAVMTFDRERYSKQSNGGKRELGDILLIRESPEYLASLVPAEAGTTDAVEPTGQETGETAADAGLQATEEGVG